MSPAPEGEALLRPVPAGFRCAGLALGLALAGMVVAGIVPGASLGGVRAASVLVAAAAGLLVPALAPEVMAGLEPALAWVLAISITMLGALGLPALPVWAPALLAVGAALVAGYLGTLRLRLNPEGLTRMQGLPGAATAPLAWSAVERLWLTRTSPGDASGGRVTVEGAGLRVTLDGRGWEGGKAYPEQVVEWVRPHAMARLEAALGAGRTLDLGPVKLKPGALGLAGFWNRRSREPMLGPVGQVLLAGLSCGVWLFLVAFAWVYYRLLGVEWLHLDEVEEIVVEGPALRIATTRGTRFVTLERVADGVYLGAALGKDGGAGPGLRNPPGRRA